MVMLKATLLLTVVQFLLSSERCESLESNVYSKLALEYYTMRDIRNVLMFICWSLKDQIKVMKSFSSSGISVSFPDGKLKNNGRNYDNIFRVNNYKMGAVFDTSCYSSNVPLRQKFNYFNESYLWLIFDETSYARSIGYLKDLPISIIADIVVVKTLTNEENTTSYELHDVYNSGFNRGGFFNVTFISKWTPLLENSLQDCQLKFFARSKVSRRPDLFGLLIRAVTFNEYNYEKKDLQTYMTEERYTHRDSAFRMNFIILQILRDLFNFTTTYVMADNWSDKNANGFYQSGNLLGVLAEKKADVMAAALQLLPDRVDITDAIHMTYPFRSGFVFLNTGDMGKLKLSFLTPFVSIVWYLFLLISVIIMVIIWSILLFENKYLSHKSNMKWSFSDTFLSVWGAWCQMGTEVQPTTHASRLVYFTLFLNSLIMYNFYTSSIVSSLLSYRAQKFTIPDLADSSIKCGSVDVGYVHNLLFDTPQYPNMEYFNSKKKTDNFYFTIEEGLKKVKQGGFAYHAEFNMLYNDISDTFEAPQICELQEVEAIPKAQLGILALKYSPYSEMFRVGAQKVRESGQLNKLSRVWVAKKPVCQANKEVSEVNLAQISSFYLVLSIGLLFSLSLFIFELRKERSYLQKEVQKKLERPIKKFKKAKKHIKIIQILDKIQERKKAAKNN